MITVLHCTVLEEHAKRLSEVHVTTAFLSLKLIVNFRLLWNHSKHASNRALQETVCSVRCTKREKRHILHVELNSSCMFKFHFVLGCRYM